MERREEEADDVLLPWGEVARFGTTYASDLTESWDREGSVETEKEYAWHGAGLVVRALLSGAGLIALLVLSRFFG